MKLMFRDGIVNVDPLAYAVPLSTQPLKVNPFFVTDPIDSTVKVSFMKKFGEVGPVPVPPFSE